MGEPEAGGAEHLVLQEFSSCFRRRPLEMARGSIEAASVWESRGLLWASEVWLFLLINVWVSGCPYSRRGGG